MPEYKDMKRKREGMKGVTLIELLMAVAILSTALVGIASLISSGLLQLQNIRVQRTAANCAKMVMEYMETIPPDDIYTWSPGVALEGDFATGAGIEQLNNFVNAGNQTCRDLSDTSNVYGKRVQMKYSLCPGCYSATQCDPVTLICWTSCYYFYRVKVTYNGVAMGDSRSEQFFTKKYHGQNRLCTDLEACGEGSIPGTLKNCSW
jgi:prepilin-type N-terminal cleavage/methylation domain-containing protein